MSFNVKRRMFVQRGVLHQGGNSRLSIGRASRTSLNADSSVLCCTTAVSLAHLEAACAVFGVPVPDYAAAAARQVESNQPHQNDVSAQYASAQNGSSQADDPQPNQKSSAQHAPAQDSSSQTFCHQQPEASSPGESPSEAQAFYKLAVQPSGVGDAPVEHANVNEAAAEGRAVPAYALQMDGLNDVLGSLTATASASASAAAVVEAAAAAAEPEAHAHGAEVKDNMHLDVTPAGREHGYSEQHMNSPGDAAKAADKPATAGEAGALHVLPKQRFQARIRNACLAQ